MRVSETLSLNIPDDDLNVDRLGRYLAKEIERFRRQVFGKVLQQIEEKEVESKKAAYSHFSSKPSAMYP